MRKSTKGWPQKAPADQDIAEIYAFLKSAPPAPALKDIPLLNQ